MSENGATLSSIGSLVAGAPGGMTIDFDPPKVTGSAFSTASVWPCAMATLADPIRSGVAPNSFDRRIRTLLPPMLRRTIWRMVWFETLAGITPRGAWGLAVQLLIQGVAGA